MANHSSNYHLFREKFPCFAYDGFDYQLDDKGLHANWSFSLAGQYVFRPTLHVPRRSWFQPDELIHPYLPSVLFHTGLVEMISYWKAACPPTVIIRPYSLSESQLHWWRELYRKGLGEFFWVNGIDTGTEPFMTIESRSDQILTPAAYPVSDGLIVPVGGGKDSAVTLEMLATFPKTIPMILNPRGASLNTIQAKGFGSNDFIELRRSIDPLLLDLNARGFLNGHTPFSALLAFHALLGALLSGRRYIALSNELSASEATIAGTDINHQYSKSLEFETDFRNYVAACITPDVEYFSFLRPLSELQIARLFSGFSGFHSVFRSCNAGSKTDTWCGSCPKCLFTAVILSPFLTDDALLRIFGKEVLADRELIPLLNQLCGIAGEKPFDCVGTTDEVNIALCEAIRRRDPAKLPPLLEYYRNSPAYRSYQSHDFGNAMLPVNNRYHVPEPFFRILQSKWDA